MKLYSMLIQISASRLIKMMVRYMLMSTYIWICNVFGLFNHNIIAGVVIWITATYVSRKIIRKAIAIIHRKKDVRIYKDTSTVKLMEAKQMEL